MYSKRHRLTLSLALVATLSGVAAAQDTEHTAYIARTVKPSSGERLNFGLWGASSVDVTEYRLNASQLNSALRANALHVDTAQLTANRTESITGWHGDIEVARRAGVYVYVATATGSTRTQAQAVIVSDLTLGVKRDNDSSLIMVNRSGQLANNIRMRIYEAQDRTTAPTLLRRYRMRRGIAYLWTRSTDSLIYVARSGRHVAIQNGWDRSHSANQTAFQVHVQTDRPLYRPGQEVHFKAILREKQNGAHRTPVGEDVRFYQRDTQGNRVRVGGGQTNAYGTVSGSLLISEAAPLGNNTLEVEAGSGTEVLGRASFGVEAYRKPEYKVTVAAVAGSYVQGETIEADVRADYFFGAPVSSARVSWTVTRRHRWRWWNPWIRPMVQRAVAPSIWWPWWGQTDVVAQGTGVTQSDGSLRIAFASTREDWDADYEIKAKVVDATNREISGSATVPVTRSALDLKLVTDRYVYQPGDRVDLRANVASTDGQPASGVSVEITISAIEPDGTKNVRLQRTLTSDAAGDAGLRLRATNRNRYEIEAKATDAAGNEVTAVRTLWVEDQRGGTDWSFNQVEITADKDVYEPGETAYLLVRAPVTHGIGLVTVEGESIEQAFMFNIIGGIGLIDLRIRDSMTPNTFVSVMVPSPDGFRSASKELQVPPIGKLINVEITADQAEYEPGETGTFRIRATDQQGRPVRAEVALGVVDEALFALREDQTGKLTDAFYPRIWNQVSTLGAMGGGFGGIRPPGIRLFAATSRAAPEAADASDGSVREYFPDTLRWLADVETDFNGEATVRLEMADNLTTWRLTARAVTRDTLLGETKTKTLVRKDLIVRLAAPRTLVEGDEFDLVGIVHNLAKPGTPGADNASVNVTLRTTNVRVLGSANRTVTVPRNGQAKVTFRVRVEEAKQATLELAGAASFEQDALRLRLPVAVRGVAAPRVESGSRMTDGDVTVRLDKDRAAIDGGTELRISLAPSLAGTLLDSVDYLVGYPYGCVEQTMSKFLPTLFVAETLQTLNRVDPNLQAELPKMVKKGIQLLEGHQNSDGGFGWFGGSGQSHPYVSAYVTYGLAIAKAQGYEVPQALWDGAMRYLRGSLADTNNTDLDGRCYQAFALVEAGESITSELTRLAGQRSQLGNYAKAVLTLALDKAGQNSLAGDLVANLASNATTNAGRAHWQGNSLRYGSWTSNTTETTAYAVQALIAVDPQNSLIPGAMAWLMSRRRGNAWTTTKDTAVVVMTLAKYVQQTGELNPNLTVTTTVNGQQVDQVRFDSASLGAKSHVVTVPGSALRDGANTIVISRQGTGALYYTAILDQKVRMNPIPAEDNGIAVTREYFKVTERIDQNGNLVEDETPVTGAVRIGDTIRVKLSLAVSRNAEVEHVNFEDRFPVGFSVVQNERRAFGWWSWWRTAKEVHDDKVVFFATRLSRWHPTSGNRAFNYSYDMRAEASGSFLALPAFAEAVYSPETNGRTAATQIDVRQ